MIYVIYICIYFNLYVYVSLCLFLMQLTFLVLPLMLNRDVHRNVFAYRNAINYHVHFHVILPPKPKHPTNDTIQIQ